MNNGRKSVIAVFLIFILPVIIGFTLFLFKDALHLTDKTINYGTLIQPIKVLGKDLVRTEKTDFFTKKWTLLLIAPQGCGEVCQDKLKLINTTRILTNNDMRRVQCNLVSSNIADKALTQTFKTLNFAMPSQDTFYTLFKEFKSTNIFLVDPLGNLMMTYSQAKPDVKKILKDFKRLLKYSRIG